jgi:hypothetical protein
MTPKEKALELIKKYSFVEIAHYTSIHEVKECALIAVDEIIEITSESYDIDHINWWQEVKQEIEKL